MKISIIVAVSENNVIGKDGKIPWYLPGDLKHFKEITTGHHIMMGRNTFESIGHPLPGRTNLVVSSKSSYSPEGVTVFKSVEDAIAFARSAGENELMVIGGASVYKSTLPLADTIYLTRISRSYEGNVCFPEINNEEWTTISLESNINNPDFEFKHLERK